MPNEKEQIIGLIHTEINELHKERTDARDKDDLFEEACADSSIGTLHQILQQIDKEVKPPQMDLPFDWPTPLEYLE